MPMTDDKSKQSRESDQAQDLNEEALDSVCGGDHGPPIMPLNSDDETSAPLRP